jgi:ankyrin repeat protein
MRGYYDIVVLLVSARADVSAEDHDALRSAAANGHYNVVEYLLDHGSFDNDALRLAIQHEHLDVAQLLIDRGADVSLWYQVEQQQQYLQLDDY